MTHGRVLHLGHDQIDHILDLLYAHHDGESFRIAVQIDQERGCNGHIEDKRLVHRSPDLCLIHPEGGTL